MCFFCVCVIAYVIVKFFQYQYVLMWPFIVTSKCPSILPAKIYALWCLEVNFKALCPWWFYNTNEE